MDVLNPDQKPGMTVGDLKGLLEHEPDDSPIYIEVWDVHDDTRTDAELTSASIVRGVNRGSRVMLHTD